jgi:membrane associated rhomboid family serine protease
MLFGAGLPGTKLLVLSCFIVLGLMAVDHGAVPIGMIEAYVPGLRPLAVSTMFRWGATLTLPGVDALALEEPFRYLSTSLVHFGLLHFGVNMLSLVSFGRVLEARFGAARIVIGFAVTGALAFVVSDLWHLVLSPYVSTLWGGDMKPVLTCGASGALFGFMGIEIGVLHVRRDPDLKARLTNYAVYAVVFALMLPVNNAAHIGGFLAGYPLGRLLERERHPARRQWLMRATAGVLFVALLGSVFMAARSPTWQQRRDYEIKTGQYP